MKRITAAIISLVMMFLCILPVAAEENQVLAFGRISIAMPQIVAEIKGNGYEEADVSAKLGTESLKVEGVTQYSKENSVCTYILVDLSTSVQGSFDLIKRSINSYVDSMGENDEVLILTFGEKEVTSLLDGTETKSEIKDKVNSLNCNEDGTLFYEALKQAYQLSNASISAFDREYVLAFSDGIDVQRGSTTYEEITELYATHTLPLYAACISDDSQEAVDNFGNLARSSGGSMKLINEDKEFTDFVQEIDDVTLLTLKANENIADGQMKQLSVKITYLQVECEVPITRSLEDNVPPVVTKSRYMPENNLFVIEFSERVSGASSISSYEISDSTGKSIGIVSAEVDESRTRAEIKVKDEVHNGIYTISFHGITDCSNEKNPLVGEQVITVKGVEEKKNETPLWVILVCVLGVVVLLVLVVVAIVFNSQKRAAESEDDELNLPSDKDSRIVEHTNSSIMQEKHHVKVEHTARIRLRIKTGRTSEQNIETNIVESLIVGRSDTCDIYIDDPKLSRQHFVIEQDEKDFYIMDLQSRNGTMVNGIRIHGRQPLRSGDKITAGLSDIYITIIE